MLPGRDIDCSLLRGLLSYRQSCTIFDLSGFARMQYNARTQRYQSGSRFQSNHIVGVISFSNLGSARMDSCQVLQEENQLRCQLFSLRQSRICCGKSWNALDWW